MIARRIETGAWLWLGALALASVVTLGFDPVAGVSPTNASLGPSFSALLGTDHLGRDVAMRVLASTQAFMLPGALAAFVAGGLGVPIGALAGWWGGWRAALLRWAAGVVASVPSFVLVVLACSIWGTSPLKLAIFAGIAGAPSLAEATFGRVASLAHAEYVLASRAFGLSDARILWIHLVWYASRRAILRGLVQVFSAFLLLETTLAYLGGFGVREPVPSWGNMVVFDWGHPNTLAVAAPALALWCTVAANLALSDALAEDADA